MGLAGNARPVTVPVARSKPVRVVVTVTTVLTPGRSPVTVMRPESSKDTRPPATDVRPDHVYARR